MCSCIPLKIRERESAHSTLSNELFTAEAVEAEIGATSMRVGNSIMPEIL